MKYTYIFFAVLVVFSNFAQESKLFTQEVERSLIDISDQKCEIRKNKNLATLKSEQSIDLNRINEDSFPFGSFDIPLEGSTVRSVIPVTGWAVDDNSGMTVRIYREEGTNQIYIADAQFVEGSRPDVTQAYPDYYGGGWAYMLFTNFLPNGGNGTVVLVVKITDASNQTVTLALHTIYCDNANAIKPFGNLETPELGGIASGSSFRVWGWVLTPQPNTIPVDGSTINVYINGVNVGHPVYNIYLSDIATLFPDYNNSNGAGGYYDLNTNPYEDGVNTIQWTAQDNVGNTDGIGSRYFLIQNGPEVQIEGKGNYIASGDDKPSITDDTEFGDMMINNGPIFHTFTIQNTGASNLDLTGDPVVNIEGEAFSVSIYPPDVIPPQSSEIFEIAFNPTSEGIKSAIITIENNDTDENPYSFSIQGNGIGDVGISNQLDHIPDSFILYQNYPNPFNPNTIIKYDLPSTSKVVLKIYTLLGQEIRTLINAYQIAGEKSVSWNGLDEQSRKVVSGIYIFRIETESYTRSKKMILIY